jgi:RHS repeat-associated protein
MSGRACVRFVVAAWLICCALPATASAQAGLRPVQIGPSGCVASNQPTFTWTAPPGAVDYRLTVFDALENAPIDVYLAANSYTPASGLTTMPPWGPTYRWKVKARYPDQEWYSEPPEGMYFTVGCTPPPGAETISYYHLDAVGSVRAVSDQAGAVVERHDYLPFGEEWCGNGPCAPDAGGERRRFTGKERDAETGLDYFGARYYPPHLGRFTTTDPVLDRGAALLNPQRWNRYSYALGNPVRFTDPDGRNPIIVGLFLGGLFLLNNPTNANVTQGPTHDAIVPNDTLIGGAGVARTLVTRGVAAAVKAELRHAAREQVLGAAEEQGKRSKRTFTTGDRKRAFENSRDAEGTPRCEYCGEELQWQQGSPGSYEADHRDAWVKTHDSSPENIAASCRGCNREKGAKDLGTEWVPPKDREE